jgi:ABC-type lipoprotein release transport system permease subunit
MLLQIAWRNIWRSKIRSFVVISAIALGLWAGVFASAFVEGMMNSKVLSLVEMELSHLQFHNQGYREDKKINNLILNDSEIYKALDSDSRVKNYTGRLGSMAMLGTASKTGSINIIAIDTAAEARLTKLDKKVVEGEYFKGIKRNPILISKKTAEDYKLKLRSKLVLTFQNTSGDISAAAFRVSGIYKSDNTMFDKMNVFIQKNDFAEVAEIDSGVHEIAVLLNTHSIADSVAIEYQSKFPELEVLPWMDLASGMRYMIDIFDVYLYIIVGIILLALLFSIVNTMFMAVLERVREIGMLMAIGMTKGRIFLMIMIETIIMTMIGCPIGLGLSWLSIEYWGNVGINLSGAAYESVGFGSMVYPSLESNDYFTVAIMVFIMSIIAAVFPARRALKLKPVEAIRKI